MNRIWFARAAFVAALLSPLLPPARAEAPPTYEAQAGWTLHLLEQARYGEAASAAQTLIRMDENAAPSYQLRGILALDIGNIGRASADFAIAAARSPEDPATDYGLALCALFHRNLDAAQAALARARSAAGLADSGAADVDTALAYVRFLRGDKSGASQLLESPAPTSDPMRQELEALMTNKRNPAAGAAQLTEFLRTPNGVPIVQEAAGPRPLFAAAPAMIEPSVTLAPLQKIYAQRLASQMAGDPNIKKARYVSGIVPLDAHLSGVSGIAYVTFSVDGQMAALVNTSPYVFNWNTTESPNGRHTVRIDALDSGGAVLTIQSQTFRVANATRSARFGGHGSLTPSQYEAIEHRLWGLVTLKPCRKVAEVMLAAAEEKHGDHAGALTHRLIAAALDPNYHGGREAARAALHGNAPGLSGTGSSHLDALWQGNPKVKTVALTFDDGPNPQKAPALLDALKKAHAPATFFVVGVRAATAPALLRRMAAGDHEVENHSFTHPNMAQVVPDEAEEEILRTSVLVRALTGRAPRFFRPPGGNAGADVCHLCHAYGLDLAYWTFDCLKEEESGSQSGLVSYVLGHVRPGAIILLHNGLDITTAAVPKLVAGLRARGYRLVTLSQMVAAGGLPVIKPGKKLRE